MGLLSEAETQLSSYTAERNWWTAPIPVMRAELALAKSEELEAIPMLEQGLHTSRIFGFPVFFLGSESLADLWEKQGDLEKALKVLEAASQEKTRAIFYSASPLFWMRVQAQLAELYRKLDREQEAQEIETELRQLLKYADADHAILRQLKRYQQARHRSTHKDDSLVSAYFRKESSDD
jgi:tetratricopeptide (TPR) repeat protein